MALSEDFESRMSSLVDLLKAKSHVAISPSSHSATLTGHAHEENRRNIHCKSEDPGPTEQAEHKSTRVKPTLIFVNSTDAVEDLHQELVRRGVTSCVPFYRYNKCTMFQNDIRKLS